MTYESLKIGHWTLTRVGGAAITLLYSDADHDQRLDSRTIRGYEIRLRQRPLPFYQWTLQWTNRIQLGSDRLFLLLAASGSKSPVVDIIEHAPCVPTPHLATPLALVSTAHPLSSFANADVMVPPNVSMAPRPSMLTADGAEELIKGYRKMKKDQNQERWSEDAKKRYEEYQKTWSKFRQTSPKKEKE